MSGFLEILGNVASGGVLGLVGQLATGWMHLKEKAQDNAFQLAMMDKQAESAKETAASVAFGASQAAEAQTNTGGVYPWAQTVKTLWRPFLTLLLLVLTTVVYFRSDPVAQSQIASAVVTASDACVFWWFGSRYQASLKGK